MVGARNRLGDGKETGHGLLGKAPLRRDQILLFCPTLDDSISQEHPVRLLEYVCGHNLDFLWLAEGRTIDHTTFCKFRTKFKGPLKGLFKDLARLAMTMGLVQLVEVAFDGTRVKADASRLHTWKAERVEAALRAEGGAIAMILGN